MSITHFLSPIKAIKTNYSSTIKLFVYVANIIYKYNYYHNEHNIYDNNFYKKHKFDIYSDK